MALRTFSSNPSLGGFGSGPSASSGLNDTNIVDPVSGGDAFAQIVKELVDNGIDACSASSSVKGTSQALDKRVRVTIEPFKPSSDNDLNDDPYKKNKQELCRVTVIDNGCGMDNIQRCIDPFQSSKQGLQSIANGSKESQTAASDREESETRKERATVGRYGIGLTLCLLHGQRLVPNSSSQITSATASCTHWSNTIWVVDTEDDNIKCVKQWCVVKSSALESGTKVTLLLPGGSSAERAWLRLGEYFNRFHLSINLTCRLEVLAPMLSSVPIYVKPLAVDDANDEVSERKGDICVSRETKALAAVNDRLLAVQSSVHKYSTRQVELKNLAYKRFPIRSETHQAIQPDTPYLEVWLAVLSPEAEVFEAERDDDEDQTVSENNRENGNDDILADKTCGEFRLIRMVNGIPLLDNIEVLGCGVVNTIASLRQVWFSFGLEVALAKIDKINLTTPALEVQDSSQILPFLAKSAHDIFEAGEDGSDDDSTSSGGDSDSDHDAVQPGRRRRQRDGLACAVLPAHVRFANAIMVVHVNGTPTSLPLPTLSKGCLPANNKAIDDALEQGLTQCLRSLQRSNPSLLFSSQMLQASERDVRYVPLLATAITSIMLNFETRSNKTTKATMRSWKQQNDSKMCATTSSQSSHLRDDDDDIDTESDDDDSNEQTDSISKGRLFASLAEDQIRLRLNQATSATKSDCEGGSSASDNSEPAAKRIYKDLLDSSSSDAESEETNGNRSSVANSGEEMHKIIDGDDSDIDDWF
ncbi:hypothetical protein MPSEU_000110400 [Mayamaea pseudoterrestris]|nr:hypothetical protein MPSEU_000110400 [Mayamaea pseudoterrestris]